MLNLLLSIVLIDGPLLAAFTITSGVLCAYLLLRTPRRRWLLIASVALLSGVALSVLTWFVVVRLNHTFDIPIDHAVYFWWAATVSAICLALANLWRSRWWRKAIAGFAILVFLVAGTLQINAKFGLDQTLGDLVGVVPQQHITLPPRLSPRRDAATSAPLWKSWRRPPNMPSHGESGTEVIPGTASGFTSRPAGIYLPPAALTPDAPALPLIILMMGQPGSPDPQYAAAVLDSFAARHDGLAPIVIVADQLGDTNHDTLCLNTTKFGNVETFITQDVVNWALQNLNITHDHRYWTIAGYSNGGECAASLIAKYPRLWSNVVDISGEEYPGSDAPTQVLNEFFGGNQAAYNAQKPENILARKKLPGTFGVFTVGSNDLGYVQGQRRMAAAAHRTGMFTVFYEVPRGGHVTPAFRDGLAKGCELLYPRLGLSRARG